MEKLEKLLTVKDLADKWQKDEGTIRRYVREGILTPCKGVPGTLFSIQYISELEGVEIDRFSPLEKRRLEKENLELKNENDKLKDILRQYQVLGCKALSLLI